MLHEQLLQQQLAAQQQETNFDKLPMHIVTTLDEMAYGIAVKEEYESFDVKKKMVANINKLSPGDLEYLVDQLSMLIDKSTNQNENIDENNVDKDFVSFLIRMYY